jgi:hypothetical protein
MNDKPSQNTQSLSMPPAVSSASDAQCAVLLAQWGTGKCAIVEPIFSEQVNGAEIKFGLAGSEDHDQRMQTPRDIQLHVERLVVGGRLIFHETTPVLTKALQECAPPRDR